MFTTLGKINNVLPNQGPWIISNKMQHGAVLTFTLDGPIGPGDEVSLLWDAPSCPFADNVAIIAVLTVEAMDHDNNDAPIVAALTKK